MSIFVWRWKVKVLWMPVFSSLHRDKGKNDVALVLKDMQNILWHLFYDTINPSFNAGHVCPVTPAWIHADQWKETLWASLDLLHTVNKEFYVYLYSSKSRPSKKTRFFFNFGIYQTFKVFTVPSYINMNCSNINNRINLLCPNRIFTFLV